MIIERAWAMPNKNTFSVKPITQFVKNELTNGFWIDPFANSNTFAEITNDLSTEYDTDYHLDALDFLKLFDDNSVDGVLFDPPYSPRQITESYQNVGIEVTQQMTQSSFYSLLKDEMSRIVKTSGKVLSFGWNSGGVGKNRGFEIQRILLVAHGSNHNDTICVSETKIL